jgi:hypothetical protein
MSDHSLHSYVPPCSRSSLHLECDNYLPYGDPASDAPNIRRDVELHLENMVQYTILSVSDSSVKIYKRSSIVLSLIASFPLDE